MFNDDDGLKFVGFGIAILAVAWICFVVWFLIQILDILRGALA